MNLSDDEIVQELERMEKHANGIREEIIRITWWMRGGVTLDQAMNLTYKEKGIVANLIKGNIEASKKSGTPIF